MQLDLNYVLIQYVHIRYLLSRHRVHLIYVFNKFNCTEYVLKVELSLEDCRLRIRCPPLLIPVLLHKLTHLLWAQRFSVLIVGTTFLSGFSRDMVTIEETP